MSLSSNIPIKRVAFLPLKFFSIALAKDLAPSSLCAPSIINVGLLSIFSILPGHLVFISPRLISSLFIFKCFNWFKISIALKASTELFT